jgi:hypothetical protein
MLVDRVLRDLDVPDEDERGGNPLRGSRLGRCARQSAYMLWPDAFPPEPLPARTKLVFAFGDMIHEMVRRQFRRVCPGEWGMEEERFHFKVPLTVKEAEAALALYRCGALRGIVQEAGMLRDYGRPWDTHLFPVEQMRHKRGLWLNLAEPALYIPLHVDGIADTGTWGLAPTEIKSMTSVGFRYALAGRLDYAYRMQMAVAVDATATDTVLYVAVRKDTCHLLEVVYSRQVGAVRVTFTKQAQLVRAFTAPLSPDVADADTSVTPMDDWEAALLEHPFEPELLDEARARVKRILMATPNNLPEREHRPDFTCRRCDGTGTQTKAKNTGLPLKKPKPCEDCETSAARSPLDVPAPTGQLAEAELPWQCRYCPSIHHCWGELQPRLDFDREAKPHFFVTRAAYIASGIGWER